MAEIEDLSGVLSYVGHSTFRKMIDLGKALYSVRSSGATKSKSYRSESHSQREVHITFKKIKALNRSFLVSLDGEIIVILFFGFKR